MVSSFCNIVVVGVLVVVVVMSLVGVSTALVLQAIKKTLTPKNEIYS